MERVPISYEIHMREFDNSLDEILEVDDALPEQDPFAQFVERAEAAFHRTSEGTAVLEKISPAYRAPTGDGNPWLVDHPTVLSKKVESEWEAPLVEDDHTLEKRIGDTTRRANVRAFIKRKLAEGETIESLATFAEKYDPTHALLIREVGAEL